MFFAIVAALIVATVTDYRLRMGALLILGMFALKAWLHHRRQGMEGQAEGKG
ncbi:MAG TPA: hypothetical protein VG892_07285 [Terriglobales bacterium]|nr:hypothetical protein [Terriglobales bacterium]